MTTAYVVMIGSQMQQDLGIEAVFSTMALARKFARARQAADGEKRMIEAFEMDVAASPQAPSRCPDA